MDKCTVCGLDHAGVEDKCSVCQEQAEFAEECDRLFQQTQDFGDDE